MQDIFLMYTSHLRLNIISWIGTEQFSLLYIKPDKFWMSSHVFQWRCSSKQSKRFCFGWGKKGCIVSSLVTFCRCTSPQGVAVGLKLHFSLTTLLVLEMKRWCQIPVQTSSRILKNNIHCTLQELYRKPLKEHWCGIYFLNADLFRRQTYLDMFL